MTQRDAHPAPHARAWQLDDAGRGFSFMRDGPLDMRMDQSGAQGGHGAPPPVAQNCGGGRAWREAVTARGWRAPTRRLSPGVRPPYAGASGGLTAAELVNTWEPREIARVLWEYGEERDSRRLARAIVAARPLQTTAQLAACLKAAAPPGPPKAATKAAARVFQALRIAVNGELEQLDGLLCARPRPPLEPLAGAEAGTRGPKPAGVVGIRQTGHETGLALPLPLSLRPPPRPLTPPHWWLARSDAAAGLVRPGGRLCVLSYHSLEDRRVKRLLRSGRLGGDSPPRDAYGNSLSAWTPLTRQPVTATEEEVALNPRARSAKLRVGERSLI